MDKGADLTQRIVIIISVILGIIIVFAIGYSLYNKAKVAEGELAKKVALDNATKNATAEANISLTGEAKNSSQFTYDGLVQKGDNQDTSTTSDFQIVNETIPVEVPQEEPVVIDATPTKPVVIKKPVVKKKVVVDEDRPLTQAEIEAIRKLPIDNSPSGILQNSLEIDSNGQYKARY